MNLPFLPWMLVALLGIVPADGGDAADDPYRWLEEVLGEKPMAWVKERNAESTGELTRADRFRALQGRIREILDSRARIPMIQKEGPYYYNFWRDAKNPRGLWRRRWARSPMTTTRIDGSRRSSARSRWPGSRSGTPRARAS